MRVTVPTEVIDAVMELHRAWRRRELLLRAWRNGGVGGILPAQNARVKREDRESWEDIEEAEARVSCLAAKAWDTDE